MLVLDEADEMLNRPVSDVFFSHENNSLEYLSL
jgi:superfamily II DNA/RNA helicase